MERVDIPTTTLRRHEAVIEESGVAAQRIIATQASAAAARLLTAGDLVSAGGAVTVMLRAAAESGKGVQTEADLALQVRSAESLESMGAPVAAAVVRVAIPDERVALARRAASQHSGDRP